MKSLSTGLILDLQSLVENQLRFYEEELELRLLSIETDFENLHKRLKFQLDLIENKSWYVIIFKVAYNRSKWRFKTFYF